MDERQRSSADKYWGGGSVDRCTGRQRQTRVLVAALISRVVTTGRLDTNGRKLHA